MISHEILTGRRADRIRREPEAEAKPALTFGKIRFRKGLNGRVLVWFEDLKRLTPEFED